MPCHNICGRCCASARCIFYYPHPLLVSAFYVTQLAIVLVLSLSPSRGITQPEAFCAGTTAAYRKGNGSNSALTPSITLHLLGCPCTRRCARHALGVARRLRRVPWLRHLLRQQLGQRAERCRGVSRVQHNLDPCDHVASTCGNMVLIGIRSTQPASAYRGWHSCWYRSLR